MFVMGQLATYPYRVLPPLKCQKMYIQNVRKKVLEKVLENAEKSAEIHHL